jgi:hypothetical protein
MELSKEYGQVVKLDLETATIEDKLSVIQTIIKMANKALGPGKTFVIIASELDDGYVWYHMDSPEWEEVDRPQFVNPFAASYNNVARIVSYGESSDLAKYELLETETYEQATERRGF